VPLSIELPHFRSPVNPCYKRKDFQIDGYQLTFDFGEWGIGHPDGTSHKYLFATYVLHETDKWGNPTGSSSYGGYGAHLLEEQLFEAVDAAGAAAFLADHLKLQNYSQTKEIIG
jgi:hypothetical protein